MRSRIFKFIPLLLLVSSVSLQAQANVVGQNDSGSARGFVREFYNWYVPKALQDNTTPAFELALKQRSSVLSPQLVLALKEDGAAQDKAPGEIVGIDFDPFLNSQDPAKHYEVGAVTQKGESYWVEICGTWPGKSHKKPDVVAELAQKNGKWVFINFHYYGNKDLLAILKALRLSRQKSTKE